MKRYRILHLITTIDLGGAEKQLLTLATHQREKGFEVEIIFLKGGSALLQDFLEKDIHVDTSFSNLGVIGQVLKLKRKKIPQNSVVHAHLPRAELLCAISLRPKTFVVTRHNSESFFPGAPKRISMMLSRFVLNRAFAIISISKAVANFLESSREISRLTRHQIIYYGLQDTSVSVRAREKRKSKTTHIGTISRLVPQKNISMLLKALNILNSNRLPRIQLSVVGVGPQGPKLRLMSTSLGIEKEVSWKGSCQNVIGFYHSLDIFVLPSEYEGFGLVLLEAMSLGIPVVARRISAIPEVVGDSHPGLINTDNPYDLAAKIEELLSNEDLVEKCLDNQAAQLKKFSIAKTQLAHEILYSGLLEKKYQE